ncbi:MAG: efflux RND transporter permease subunit [Candidatus Omnitrophota bacterium]|jgi:multidrug efflux pump subunit AcrB
MKALANFSVKHSLFVNLLSAFLVIAGLFSMFRLRREAFPEVSFDVVNVSTIYKGATPEEVERLVTTPLENELKEVDNIEEMSSISSESLSTIVLRMNPDVKDKRKVVDDIQKAVDRVTELPQDSEEPLVTEITSKEIPVIIVSLSGDLPELELQQYAESLEDEFIDISGVASVKRRGYRDREFWIQSDLEKMKEYYVSFDEIVDSLRRRNVGLPGGKIETPQTVFNVKTTGEFYTKEEIENVVIRSNTEGNLLRIKDVAEVIDTFEEENIINKTEKTRAISLIVVKREKGDAIKIVGDVHKTIELFKNKAPDELNLKTFYDLSFYIKRRLNVLRSNGIFAITFVVAALFLFLHPRPALFTAFGIPIALLTTFWVMDLSGMSINLISMFGLIVVLGMLVDDGIIISENVYRYVEGGMPPREAAIKGTSEVIAPVFATVLTTIAAFSPLMFMTGLIGKFISQIPKVVCIALGASLIEAFIILPSHLADFTRPIAHHPDKQDKHTAKSPWLIGVIKRYEALLIRALRNRYKVCAGIFLLFIIAIAVAKFFMPFILFSGRGVEQFMIRAESKVGTPLDKMNKFMAPVEDLVAGIPKQYVDTYETQVGILEEERGFDPDVRRASNLAQINVYLTPSQVRKKTAEEIVDQYRPELKKITGFEKLYFREFREGPPVGKPIYARIRGEDYNVINDIVSQVKDYLNSQEGILDITDSYDLGDKEFHVVVNQESASSSYLDIGQIAQSVRNAFEGRVATSIKPTKAEEEIAVRVRLPEYQRNQLDIFDNLVIANQFGNLIPLNTVASVKETQGLRSVRHLDGKRFVSVSAEVDNQKMTSAKANQLLKNKFKNISIDHPGYTIRYGGEEEETQKSMRSLFSAFLLAFLLIFLILATQFNSLVQPFVVMLTIPFGLIGVVFALLIHGEPFSFFAILGLVGLVGIVVNDSIVLMDFINKLRAQGVSRKNSIIQAGKLRFRPVILTTLTTVAGISTVAYGIGGRDPFLQPMALTISWGLTFATGLTLIIIPCIYAIVDDITEKIIHHPTVYKKLNNFHNPRR